MIAIDQQQADSPGQPVKDLLADESYLSELRASLLAFARLQLDDAALAEDAVQEALSGALAGAASFQRRSALRTWVFAILRNKLADTLRGQSRYVDAESVVGGEGGHETFEQLFDRTGHWAPESIPRGWRAPLEACSDERFWRVFDACLEHLPAQQARLFMMREVLELDTPEILRATGVTQSNMNVLMYRARMRLRECLDTRWFDRGEVRAC